MLEAGSALLLLGTLQVAQGTAQSPSPGQASINTCPSGGGLCYLGQVTVHLSQSLPVHSPAECKTRC